MKNILLPTDFSENSWNAICYAIQIFKDETCTFFLLNTYTPVIYHVEYVLGYPAQFGMEDIPRNTSQENLNELKQRIVDSFGNNTKHDFQTMARFDTLLSGITEFMDSHDIHMIIMGTNGATGAKEVLFGSNTVQVFKNVRCPVLAIPDNFKYKELDHILFPTDYGIDYPASQLQPLLSLAEMHTAKIDILHILTDPLSKTQIENKIILEQLMRAKNHQFHDLTEYNVMLGITAFETNNKIDMMVMINNKHSFFENIFFKSTLNQIGFRLSVPLLVIPSYKK